MEQRFSSVRFANIRHFANIVINDALGSVNFAILVQVTVNDHIRRD